METEKLEKETPLLKSILEAVQDPFFILSPEGEFLMANSRGMEILKLAREELQGRIFHEVSRRKTGAGSEGDLKRC